MAENPLLPNRRLKELLELMRRCHTLDRGKKMPAREALLAGTAIQLEPGDLLSAPASDKTAATLAPAQNPNSRVTWSAIVEPESNVALPKAPRLALAAAMANGLRASGAGGVVLALVDAGATEPALAETLAYAQHARVPLLIAITDATSGRAGSGKVSPEKLSFANVSKIAAKLQFPLFPVDGEDAVAVYRVMQEGTLRARLGEGPAIFWGVMSSSSLNRLAPNAKPIARMEKYLDVRGLLPRKKSG